MAEDGEFIEYATARAGRLRDLAYLMCGDWHLAQDLTQQTLARLYVAWPRIRQREQVDAYARQVLLRELLMQRRRRSSTERPTATVPDQATGQATEQATGPDLSDLRLTLIEALGRLAPNRRAVLVLRFWEDLSVTTVAEILQSSPSAVKSLTVRALQDLRAILGADLPALQP